MISKRRRWSGFGKDRGIWKVWKTERRWEGGIASVGGGQRDMPFVLYLFT